MNNLNVNCRNDVSDDDCKKCFVNGIIFSCPAMCADYEAVTPKTRRTVIKKQSFGISVNNAPTVIEPYIVVKAINGAVWYYGQYEPREKALEVAREVNGFIAENEL